MVLRGAMVVVLVAAVAGPAFAQDQGKQASDLTEVLRRLDVVERENAELRKEVDRLGGEKSAIQTEELRALVSEIMQKEREALGKTDFRVYWQDGIRFDTPNPDFKLAFGGRIYSDWAHFRSDGDVRAAFGDPEDGTEFRAARLFVSGQVYDNVEFKGEYDFAGGDADFKDVYIRLTGLPVVGAVTVGHFKEPFSLEELTSSRFTTFMERGLPNVFAPGRNVGVGISNTCADDRVTWSAGIFRETDDFGSGFGSGHHITARVTGLPVYADGGAQLVHTGVSYSHVATDTLEFDSRPESHLAEKLLSTGEFAAADADLVALEGACVLGPFSVQAEYMAAFTNPSFTGFYVYGSYFLTGEHRAYKKSSGAFDRVKPKSNFGGEEGGLGAWELAARYSYVDLRSDGLDGGELSDYTVGLNWYLNPNMRVMFNYVLADPSGFGEAHAFMIRLQIDF